MSVRWTDEWKEQRQVCGEGGMIRVMRTKGLGPCDERLSQLDLERSSE